jgi:hypothetical protein
MVRTGKCLATFLDPGATSAELKRARGEIDALVALHQDIVM